jgi:hypothetical protein
MPNEWVIVVQCQMREWMLFNAKWENESCSMPNEWVIVVQCQIREWKLFNAKWVNECCLMPNGWMNVGLMVNERMKVV